MLRRLVARRRDLHPKAAAARAVLLRCVMDYSTTLSENGPHKAWVDLLKKKVRESRDLAEVGES